MADVFVFFFFFGFFFLIGTGLSDSAGAAVGLFSDCAFFFFGWQKKILFEDPRQAWLALRICQCLSVERSQ
jgi:hypothetical protein